MKKLILIATALFVSGIAVATAQQTPQTQQNDQPYVEISSSADTLVVPNKFRISITISEEPSKGKVTISSLEKSLATALKASDVDIKKQLVITGQSSADGKRKDIYQYKNYLLTLTNAATVNTVFDQLQANGISNSRLSQSTRSDMSELQAVVRVKAMHNARQSATELAATLGQSVGKAIMIQAYTSDMPVAVGHFGGNRMMKSGNAMQEDAAMPELKFNDVRVSQNVTVRFILK